MIDPLYSDPAVFEEEEVASTNPLEEEGRSKLALALATAVLEVSFGSNNFILRQACSVLLKHTPSIEI